MPETVHSLERLILEFQLRLDVLLTSVLAYHMGTVKEE